LSLEKWYLNKYGLCATLSYPIYIECCFNSWSKIVSSNTPGLSTPERTVIYTWLFPWEQISSNKIPFMFLFLFHHGILPVHINNYSNVIKVTQWWTLGLWKSLIIKVLYHWASPYTRNWWWCTVDCGWVYRKSDNIDKSIVVWLFNSRMKKKKNDHNEKR
jgi:hypothetical protein